MKSIQNALLLLIPIIGLNACSSVKPLQCETKPIERAPLSIADPQPLDLSPVRWKIITRENIDRVWQEIENSGNEVVLFAITSDGYEQLALDFAAIRNHINQQRTIILKYKEYYETDTAKNSKNNNSTN